MKEIYRKFSQLLATTVTGVGTLPDVDAGDWESFSAIAALHNLQTMLYYAAEAFGQEQQPSRELCDRLLRCAKSELLIDTHQKLALTQLQNALQTEQIRAVTLKGGMLKELYAKPEMRFTSDIDLWVNPDDRQKLHEVLLRLGFTEAAKCAYTRAGNVRIETHYAIAFHNKHEVWTAYFAQMQQTALAQSPCALTLEQHYLYLLCHYMMHFEAKGIGLRQSLDLWCYRKHFVLDEALLREAYETLGITEFVRNLEHMLHALFDGGETDDLTEEMIEYIFSCGMFGNRKNAVARQLASSGGKGKYLRKRLFPTLPEMRKQYPALKKAPILLPLFWIWRAVHGIFCKKDHMKRELHASRGATMQEAEQLTDFNRRVGIPKN